MCVEHFFHQFNIHTNSVYSEWGEGDRQRQRQKTVHKNRKTFSSSFSLSVCVSLLLLLSVHAHLHLKKFGAREKKRILHIFSPVRTDCEWICVYVRVVCCMCQSVFVFVSNFFLSRTPPIKLYWTQQRQRQWSREKIHTIKHPSSVVLILDCVICWACVQIIMIFFYVQTSKHNAHTLETCNAFKSNKRVHTIISNDGQKEWKSSERAKA